MVALTGMEASAKSAGQGRPATFYRDSLSTHTLPCRTRYLKMSPKVRSLIL